VKLLHRLRQLSAHGVLGLNERNGDFIMRHNPRALYPLVDDKLRSKELALAAGMAVPPLYGLIRTEHDAGELTQTLAERDSFVVKPAHGSGGDGILVVSHRGHRRRDRFHLIDGKIMQLAELRYHVSNILSGQYSLGGNPDQALIEYCVQHDPVFQAISYLGIPDIRIIVFLGYPVMAMVRLPTRLSGGKANLHQGAVGAGIDIATGLTGVGVLANDMVDEHPDTGNMVTGVQVPRWAEIMALAARCYDVVGLGFLGVDIVLDRERGPLILELNARPGLNIQIANRAGLGKRLREVEAWPHRDADFIARIKRSQAAFAA
jgi:alpha-L-glutamate ligase-like protein